MKILFIGDIIAKVGRQAVRAILPELVARRGIDLVVANGENAAAGFGITEKVAKELFEIGVHVITSGNHIWDKKEIVSYIVQDDRLLRPLNYPPGTPGFGSCIYTTKSGIKAGVINLAGRIFMTPLDCPFRAVSSEVKRISKEVQVILVDIHAEATSEKIAMGYYLNGMVSAVVGTHTHVQTADERVLPGGKTAYITDVGMTGPVESVIGVSVDQIVGKFLSQMPVKYDVAAGSVLFCAVLVDIDEMTGHARSIERIQRIIG